MKICIYGAGAIGGSMAARLLSAGYDTSVVARGAHLAAIKADGLYCEAPDKRYGGKLKASDKPADLGPQDCVIVAVKAHMLKDIAAGLKPLLHDKTSIVYALNGIPWWYFHGIGGAQDGKRLDRLDPGGLQWDHVGAGRAIGCTLSYPASVIGPGLVRQIQATNTIALGEPNGTQSERLEAIAQAMAAAGFKVESKSPIREQVWIKHRRLVPTSLLAILATADGGTGGIECGSAPDLAGGPRRTGGTCRGLRIRRAAGFRRAGEGPVAGSAPAVDFAGSRSRPQHGDRRAIRRDTGYGAGSECARSRRWTC